MAHLLLTFFILAAAGCARYEPVVQKKSVISYSESSGESSDSAIVISGVLKPSEGIEAEYHFISRFHGAKDREWRIEGQTMYREGKKAIDVIEIVLMPSSEKRIYYFDVTAFPWKTRERK